MSTPTITMSYPLRWVENRPRTRDRKAALWRNEGRAVSMTVAKQRLASQVSAMTKPGKPWRVTNMILSTDIELRKDGGARLDRRDPSDPGVAFYFSLDGKPHALACDRWDRVADNIAAIAAHIEALRGQERWGVADMAQAFAGHVALPAPEQWWQVLGVRRDASAAEINAAYRAKARAAHPDTGGSEAAMARLNAARDAASDPTP